MKKRAISLLISALLVLSLAACGGNIPNQAPNNSSNSPSSQPPASPQIDTTADNFWENMEFPEEVHLTCATSSAKDSGVPRLERIVELVEERSGGKIIIDIAYNGVLGNEQSTFAQCMEGSIDMATSSLSSISPYTSYLDVFQLPFLIGTYEQEWEVMQTDEWKTLWNRADEDLEGITFLNMGDFGMRQFATVNKPICTIDDLAGMKIRSIGNPIVDQALQLVGANPVNIPYTDLYTSLQNKVIDGEEINTASVSTQKHYEVINYISEIGFYPFLTITVVSEATVNTLPDGYYDLIKAVAAEVDEWYMTEAIYDWDATTRQQCVDNNVEFNTIEDKDVWLERVQPIYEQVSQSDPMYAAFIEKALSLQK